MSQGHKPQGSSFIAILCGIMPFWAWAWGLHPVCVAPVSEDLASMRKGVSVRLPTPDPHSLFHSHPFPQPSYALRQRKAAEPTLPWVRCASEKG